MHVMQNNNATSYLYGAQENGAVDDPLVQSSRNGNSDRSSYQKQIFSTDEADAKDDPQTSMVYGRLLLFVVAFLYGSLNVSLRLVYELPGPPSASALSTTRGWLAALCFVPLLATRRRSRVNEVEPVGTTPRVSSSLWRVAAELALFNFGAQGLLNLGLISVESARASFLTQTSVVITPIISALAGQQIHCRVWIGCLVALIGLVLLSDEDGLTSWGFGSGDLLILAGALCWSCYLFRLSAIGNQFDEIELQGAKTFLMAILYSIWFIISAIRSDVVGGLWLGWTNPVAWAIIFYSAIGPGTFADIVQQKGQASVSAAEANVILSMEPVFTAILGLLFMGEATTWQEKWGGGLIIFASIISTN
jgi:drug/metabolite transporter (DMT)-like permease